MKLLKGYYAYLAVSGGLLLGLAAQNNWALQMLAFALVSAGALSVQNVSRWYMRASIAADVTMAFKLILGPAVIPPGLLRIVLQYAALVPLLLTGCMLLLGVKEQMQKIEHSTLPEWALLAVWSAGYILVLVSAPGWLNDYLFNTVWTLANSLISIGGGSSHDCCKGIGLVVSNGGKIHDYEGVDKSTKAMPPYLAVNTTAGTASEITRFCIITDSARKVKMAIVDWRITPSVAINDPILMVGMPPALTAATGMDALTHAVEAYVSTGATPLTDACAEKAIKLVSENLRRAVANGSDIHAREGMCYAQYLAGMAFNNASLGHVHAMAHQLGGFYNLPHGECNAILLPHVESFNLISRLDRFVRIAQMMGECTDGLSERAAAELAISAIKTLSKDVGIPTTITELAARYVKAIDPRDIPAMVGHAQKDTCAATNPRTMSLEIISQLYKDVF